MPEKINLNKMMALNLTPPLLTSSLLLLTLGDVCGNVIGSTTTARKLEIDNYCNFMLLL